MYQFDEVLQAAAVSRCLHPDVDPSQQSGNGVDVGVLPSKVVFRIEGIRYVDPKLSLAIDHFPLVLVLPTVIVDKMLHKLRYMRIFVVASHSIDQQEQGKGFKTPSFVIM